MALGEPTKEHDRSAPISVDAIPLGNAGSIYSRIGGMDTTAAKVVPFVDAKKTRRLGSTSVASMALELSRRSR